MGLVVILKSYLLSLELKYWIWRCERLHKKWLKLQNATEAIADGREPKNLLTNSLLEVRPMSMELLEEKEKKE